MTVVPAFKSLPRHAQGFALIEALVAILLFAIGVLGLVGLQTGMTQAQTETRARSESAFLAQELIGLMWTDVANLSGYAISGTAASGSATCTATPCQRWLDKLQKTLPNSSANIEIASGDDNTAANIEIFWQLPNGDQRRYATATNFARSYTE